MMELKREWVIPSIVGVVSFGAGVAAGYFARIYQANREIEEIIEEEDPEDANFQLQFEFDERTRVFNHAMQEASFIMTQLKEGAQSFLDQRADDMHRSMASHPAFRETEDGEIEIIPLVEEPVEIHQTIFSDNGDEIWDWEIEKECRGPDEPYIIHHDEFFEKEADMYSQTCLTYYKGDNILCDEEDTPLYGFERIVGELKFGHGSLDSNVVYIRNERLEAEYEVTLDHGYYQVQVLGQAIEDDLNRDVKHSVRKFRQD
jgi:hypothetical protein